jgi:hypothetical protein
MAPQHILRPIGDDYILACAWCDGFWPASNLDEWEGPFVCSRCRALDSECEEPPECETCGTPVFDGFCACVRNPSAE